MNTFNITGPVQRFPGKAGWHYVELNEEMSSDFRSIVKEKWPALLGAEFTLGTTTWKSSIMPIKDGPLFIALPAKVRKAENIVEGQEVAIEFTIST